MKKKILFIILVGLLVSNFATAQLVNCGTEANPEPCQLGDLFALVINIINFLLSFAGLICIFFILYGGIRMILSRGNQQGVEAAKSTVTNALIGFVITLGAYLIVNVALQLIVGPNEDLRSFFERFRGR